MFKFPYFRRQKGFTLIELLVSIGIVGTLAGVTIAAVNPAQMFQDAKTEAQIRSDLNTLQKAYEQAVVDGLSFASLATSIETAVQICRDTVTGATCTVTNNGFDLSQLATNGEYVVNVPINPYATDANMTKYYIYSTNGFVQFCATEIQSTCGTSDGSPTVSTYSPTDNATGVAVSANLVLTFSEAVDPESGADNDIVIKRTSDDVTIETIDAEAAAVTGGGTDTITINPTSDLANSTEYYVQIGADAFDNAGGDSYAGISDTTTWSFTTAGLTTLFNDTFTVGSDTNLDVHTPDTGDSWTDALGNTNQLIADANSDAVEETGTSDDTGFLYIAEIDGVGSAYPTANYTVSMTMKNDQSSDGCLIAGECWLVARYQGGVNQDMYAFRTDGSGGGDSVYLLKRSGGSWTTLGTESSYSLGDGSVITLQVNGTSIVVEDDGTEVFSVTDSDISGAGRAGFAHGEVLGEGSGIWDNTDSGFVDNFSVTY